MNIDEKNWKLWLIKSTYGLKHSVYYPKDVCDFARKLIISIVFLPFCYVSHLINLFSRKIEFSGGFGFGVIVISMLVGSGIVTEHCQINFLYDPDRSLFGDIAIVYALAVPIAVCGLFLIAAIALISLGFSIPIEYVVKKINNRPKKSTDKIANKKGLVATYIENIKKKHCTRITYTFDSSGSSNSSDY